MHILDKINNESIILNSLIKEFKEKKDKDTLKKLEESNEKQLTVRQINESRKVIKVSAYTCTNNRLSKFYCH